jgi:hypothetical protein
MRLYFTTQHAEPSMADPKSSPSTFRFTPEVKEALALISEREGRSMASMLEWLIKKHCENSCLGWPPLPDHSIAGGGAAARHGAAKAS